MFRYILIFVLTFTLLGNLVTSALAQKSINFCQGRCLAKSAKASLKDMLINKETVQEIFNTDFEIWWEQARWENLMLTGPFQCQNFQIIIY